MQGSLKITYVLESTIDGKTQLETRKNIWILLLRSILYGQIPRGNAILVVCPTLTIVKGQY